MANRILRFILDNDTEGSLQVDDPLGFEEMDLILTRDNKFFAISSELMEIELGFYGEAKDYLLNILDTQGPDNEVRVDLDLSTDKGQNYEDVFNGIGDWSTFTDSFVGDRGHIASMVFVRSSFFTSFMNHKDTEVDLQTTTDIYGDTRETINTQTQTMHSFTIRFSFEGALVAGITDSENLVGVQTPTRYIWPNHSQENDLDLNKHLKDEYTTQLNSVVPDFFFRIKDFNADYVIEIDTDVDINMTNATVNYDDIQVQWKVRVNAGGVQNIGGSISLSSIGVSTDQNLNLTTTGTLALNGLKIEDEIKLYCQIDVVLEVNGDFDLDFEINKHETTLFTNQDHNVTNIPVYMVHELGNKILGLITGTNSRFFSEYLGNRVTQIQNYSTNQCGSYFAIVQGLQVRFKTLIQGPWSMSFEKYFDSLDAIFNLGLVVEDSGGSDRVRIEPKHFFFQSGSPVLQLLDVDYEKTIATEWIYKEVEIGYQKWETEEAQSDSEWNTNQTRTSRYKSIGVDKTLLSGFVAGAYAVEITRRQRNTSKDWKYDNDDFILAVNRSVDGSEDPNNLTTCEKDENFIDVNNILFESVAYNLRLSPARNFLRWGNVLNVGLVDYAGDLWRWQGGEGNQDFESRIDDGCEGSFNNLMLEENNDIQWDYSASPSTDEQTPLFKPIWYTFKTELSFDDYKTLRDNKTNSFEIVARDGTIIEVFLWELRYNLFQGQGEFKAIEANV